MDMRSDIMHLLDYFHGRAILFCLFGLACSIYQSYQANKFINRVNEENLSDYHKPQHMRAPFVELIIVFILLVVCIAVPVK